MENIESLATTPNITFLKIIYHEYSAKYLANLLSKIFDLPYLLGNIKVNVSVDHFRNFVCATPKASLLGFKPYRKETTLILEQLEKLVQDNMFGIQYLRLL